MAQTAISRMMAQFVVEKKSRGNGQNSCSVDVTLKKINTQYPV